MSKRIYVWYKAVWSFGSHLLLLQLVKLSADCTTCFNIILVRKYPQRVTLVGTFALPMAQSLEIRHCFQEEHDASIWNVISLLLHTDTSFLNRCTVDYNRYMRNVVFLVYLVNGRCFSFQCFPISEGALLWNIVRMIHSTGKPEKTCPSTTLSITFHRDWSKIESGPPRFETGDWSPGRSC
jgi:hypothetical protein